MAKFSLTVVFIIITFCLLCSCSYVFASLIALSQSQPLTNDTLLVSKGEIFALGFFQPGNSKNWYLGIWYNKIPIRTVVWVANRINPINGSSVVLAVNNETGNFDLLSQSSKTAIWSTSSVRRAQSPVMELLDSGNLVLRDEKDEMRDNYLWQSFDYPCDTLLPGMKLGWDKIRSLNRRLSAWKSPDDPSPGELTWEMELHEYPEPVMWNGTKEFLRSGPWNGIQYSGKPTKALPSLKYSFFSSEDEIYLTIKMVNESRLGRMVLNETNFHRQSLIWSEAEKNWTMYAAFPRDRCDEYLLCGGNAFCSLSMTPNCQCLDKFSPKSPEKWHSGQWSGGCERRKALRNCRNDDGFMKVVGLKLPDTTKTWVNGSLGLKECRANCLSNCSCMAYSNTDVRDGGKGCANWHGDLLDMKQIPGGGQDFYVRVRASEIGDRGDKWKIGLIIAFSIFISLGLILLYYFTCNKRRKLQARNNEDQEDLELPLFDLSTITSATDGFSFSNKLGEGGFGPVYRGGLVDGREIAVKRLSRSSGQGLTEFKNEVILIAKLQHRNLVRLLGCCIEGDEKLLVYEFMPNKSLDYFIFDETRGKLLNWPTRFNIISGIARGLLYLHQDSRLRIIHRDLKASNVLLDREMNPKISDFGLARTFGGDETEGNTNRIVGTYGYMAPEYATEGQFSVKSDVFSFGILLLEIISGKRSKGFYNMKQNVSLIGNAWTMWREGRPLEVMDEKIANSSCHVSQVMRCVHVSLLCVQQRPEERPTMSAVVQMLGSEAPLPEPTQPGFVAVEKRSVPLGEYSAPVTHELVSVNEVTITLLHAR